MRAKCQSAARIKRLVHRTQARAHSGKLGQRAHPQRLGSLALAHASWSIGASRMSGPNGRPLAARSICNRPSAFAPPVRFKPFSLKDSKVEA
jgi:hypothetical protein